VADPNVMIVTGAAGGLGRVYALGLAQAGYRVAAADIADTSAIVAEVEAAGGTAFGVHADVADEASTEAMAAAVLDRFGRIDGLINNAAYYTAIVKKPFDEITVEEWDRCFAVNVRGAWLCTRAVTPAMKEQRSGKILNVSSTTVPTGLDGFLHYVSSKSAIVGLSRSLARELGPWNIAVNTVTPDYIAFDRDYDDRQPELAGILAQQRCLKREVQPEDVLGAVLYLVGPGSEMVTGQNFHVNGGRFFS
jgi:3-oxoacyl-[acyl-carrier protein] reductase